MFNTFQYFPSVFTHVYVKFPSPNLSRKNSLLSRNKRPQLHSQTDKQFQQVRRIKVIPRQIRLVITINWAASTKKYIVKF